MAEDSSLGFIVDAIASAGEIKMNFKELATSTGIARFDNAGTKFQNQLKKCGYKYDKDRGRLVKLDGTHAPATPPKKAATNGQKASGKKGTAKKRKLEEAEGEDGASSVDDDAK